MRFTPIILHRSDPVSWMLMPKFIERVKGFMESYNSDADGPLPDIIHTAFGGGDPRAFLCAIIDGEEKCIAGHMVAGVETYLGEPTGFIHQWEIDKGLPPDELEKIRATIDAMMMTWATGLNLKSMTAMALDEARAKVFKRHRFNRFAVLVKRRLR